MALALLLTSLGSHAQQPVAAAQALCAEASEGRLTARIQGAIDGEVDWSASEGHCLGGVRPDGTGLRLVFKGAGPAGEPLLIVIGAGPVTPGASARNVPANVTIVVEGSGRFFATQGDDKCAFDSLEQQAVPGDAGLLRVRGRGYCVQPARAVGGDGSVLLARFDALALVRESADPPPPAAPGRGDDNRLPLAAFPSEPIVIETRSARRHVFKAWRAETPASRAQGLMFVEELPDDRAMIFAYDPPQRVGMWMKNTLLPLDMLFVDERGCVVRLHERAEPGSLETIESGVPVVLVVELPGGTAEARGIGRGDRVVRPQAGWPSEAAAGHCRP